jgi:diguanylate cyclase (GGDEF)-like protein
MGGFARHWRILLIGSLLGFFFALVASEYLDLPHLFFGLAPTAPNPGEVFLEGSITLVGGVLLWNLIGRFVTRLNSSMDELQRLATHDDLTGIPNRRQCLERLGAEFDRALRFNRPLSIAIIDLDGFKSINDSQGHLAGDKTLISFTRVVTRHVRAQDFFGRLGGDEFLVLFIETGAKEGGVILNRVRERWANAYAPTITRGSSPITLSAGVTSPLPGDESMTDCLRRADEGLMRAKANGRNRIELA